MSKEEGEEEEGRQLRCRPGRFQRFPTWASESASSSPQAGAAGKPKKPKNNKTKISGELQEVASDQADLSEIMII